MSVEKSYSIIFNSNSTISTPLNPETFNNEYAVNLNNLISVPSTATSCKVGIISGNVWNYDANIREFPVLDSNNKFYFKPDAGTAFVEMTIPQGYYGLSDLNTQIAIQLQLLGYDNDLFSLTGDSATQKVIINFSKAGTQIDFIQPNTIKNIVGFDSRLSPPALSTAGQIDVGDSVAQFNSVNSFLISCNALVGQGLPVNTVGRSILASIPVTSPPNSLVNYNPNQVAWIENSDLIGNPRSDIQFSLLNELLEPVFVLDDFSFTVTIKWTEN